MLLNGFYGNDPCDFLTSKPLPWPNPSNEATGEGADLDMMEVPCIGGTCRPHLSSTQIHLRP